MDLGSRKHVVAVATQGRYGSSDWTSKYQILYSDSQKNWRPYLQDGNAWVRQGLRPGGGCSAGLLTAMGVAVTPGAPSIDL